MSETLLKCWDRRAFLAMAFGLPVGYVFARDERDDRPDRDWAISGDSQEAIWDERVVLTVGVSEGDLIGKTDRVIQAAIDSIERLGGGTVKLLPGIFRCRDSVRLRKGVKLLGSGPETVLFKEPSVTIPLSADADWYDQEIKLPDTPEARSLRVGDGLCLETERETGCAIVLKRKIVARSGTRFKLDRALREDFWIKGKARASSLFSLIEGDGISDVVVENLTLDGNRANNACMDDNYGAALFLQDCNRVLIKAVTARDYNGDGIALAIAHDVTIEGCQLLNNSLLGVHAGSGSQRPIIRGNTLRGNGTGLHFCWGVRHALAEKNRIEDTIQHGISIGHRDTDNLIRDNEILKSGVHGVLFREERGKQFAPHRNRLESNRIVDSGPEGGIAVQVLGQPEGVIFARNEILDTRQPLSRTGVRLGEKAGAITLSENRIEGFKRAVDDRRPSALTTGRRGS